MQTGLLSPPVLFCSPAHEIISVLFRAGTVNPCGLSHCGFALLNVLCLKAQGKKQVFCMSSPRSTVHLIPGFPAHLSLSAASGKLPSSRLVVTLQQVLVTCCTGSCCNPLLQPRTCCARYWLRSLPPSSQNSGDLGLLLMCTCRISFSPE